MRLHFPSLLLLFLGTVTLTTTLAAPPTYYEILEVDSDATAKDIKRAFHAKARSVHPDHRGSNKEFIRLRDAFESLSDTNSRAAYDLFLWRHNGHHHDDWDSGAFSTWQAAMITLGFDGIHWFLQLVLLILYLAFFSLVGGGVLTLLKPVLSAFASMSFYIVIISSIYSTVTSMKH